MGNFLDRIKNKKNIHLVGVSGAEGSAIASFLIAQNFKNITAHDFCEKEDFKKNFFSFLDSLTEEEKESLFLEIINSKINIKFKSEYLEGIEKADIIFVPQSWFRYDFNKPLEKLFQKIEFCNITKLYFNLCKAPIIAVTGTSGKSTTTRLIYEIFKKENRKKVYFSGNDRENIQILKNVLDIKKDDLLILEVSNRQLKMDIKKSPHIGVITNISSNHLDDHKDFDDYVKTKNKLIEYQKKEDFAVLNYNIQKISDFKIKSNTYYFTKKEILLKEGAYLKGNDLIVKKKDREYIICSTLDLKIPGKHNIENVLAASLVGILSDVNPKVIRKAITEFRGLKSRLEFVKEVNGIKYYNDSAACNPDGLVVAIRSFVVPLVLIAGGIRKKMIPGEIDKMADAIIRRKVKGLVLIGKVAEEIKRNLEKKMIKNNTVYPIIRVCHTLSEAFASARKIAEKGDIILLSPGFESFDMFVDYRDRANQFKKLVNNISS